MAVWLQDYFVPVARDPTRNDVMIPNVDQFVEIVESYKRDPCERLIRHPENNAYILDPSLGATMQAPPKPSATIQTLHKFYRQLNHTKVIKRQKAQQQQQQQQQQKRYASLDQNKRGGKRPTVTVSTTARRSNAMPEERQYHREEEDVDEENEEGI
jgi:hypothetical protein